VKNLIGYCTNQCKAVATELDEANKLRQNADARRKRILAQRKQQQQLQAGVQDSDGSEDDPLEDNSQNHSSQPAGPTQPHNQGHISSPRNKTQGKQNNNARRRLNLASAQDNESQPDNDEDDEENQSQDSGRKAKKRKKTKRNTQTESESESEDSNDSEEDSDNSPVKKRKRDDNILKASDCPAFDGMSTSDSMSVNEFLSRLEICIKNRHIKKPGKQLLTVLKPKSPASIWYNTVKEDIQDKSWKDIKKMFLNHFALKPRDKIQRLLAEPKLNKDESVGTFWIRLTDANQDLPAKERFHDSALITHFTNTLKRQPGELGKAYKQAFIQLREDDDADTAVRIAERVENEFNSIQDSAKTTHRSSKSSRNQSRTSSPVAKDKKNMSEADLVQLITDKVVAHINNKQQPVKSSNQPQHQNQQRPQGQANANDDSKGNNRNYNRNSNKGICFYCDKPGHFLKACRKFKNDKRNNCVDSSRFTKPRPVQGPYRNNNAAFAMGQRSFVQPSPMQPHFMPMQQPCHGQPVMYMTPMPPQMVLPAQSQSKNYNAEGPQLQRQQ
jgi:hypothetical protein